jgi:hypothetical protein
MKVFPRLKGRRLSMFSEAVREHPDEAWIAAAFNLSLSSEAEVNVDGRTPERVGAEGSRKLQVGN